MKTLLLTLLLVPMMSFGQQLVYVPDDVLENLIESTCPAADNGIPNDNYVIKPINGCGVSSIGVGLDSYSVQWYNGNLTGGSRISLALNPSY